MTTTPSTWELIEMGLESRSDEHAAAEEEKLGMLRGGSAGIALFDGNFAGQCQRKALARSLGYDSPTDMSSEFMFEGGRRNEDSWQDILSRGWRGEILREDECGIAWETSSGVPITGRPDIVLVDESGRPDRVLELKAASSLWTGRTVLFGDGTHGRGEPKLDHLIQAAHYGWKLGEKYGLPAPLRTEIWYTSTVKYTPPAWASKHFPKAGEPGSEWIEYTYYEASNERYTRGKNKGRAKLRKVQVHPDDARFLSYKELLQAYPSIISSEMKALLPFKVGFELDYDQEGGVSWRKLRDPAATWIESPVDLGAIESFYEWVATAEERQELGPRPLTLDAHGDTANYSSCDYCPLSRVCDRYEGQVEKWLEHVRELASRGE